MSVDWGDISRYAEAFDTVEECRARFEQIKAHLHPTSGYTASAYRLQPQQGVPGWTVAVVAAGSRQPRFVPHGRPVDLPDYVWGELVMQAYAAERERLAARERPGHQHEGTERTPEEFARLAEDVLAPIAEREGLFLQTFVVGQPYPIDMTTVPAQPGGAYQYNYRAGYHTLELFVPGPVPQEVRDVESSPVEFALTIDEPAIYLLFRFEGWPWNYCAYSWHLLEDDPAARALPPEPKDGASHAVLSIFLVDADTGILRAMRACSFSRAFTKKLHDAIRAQAKQAFDRDAYACHVDRIDDKRTTPQMVGKRLLARAVARTHGGD